MANYPFQLMTTRAAGMMIGDFDLLMGATALQYDLTLLSNNRQHFERIEGLRLVSMSHLLYIFREKWLSGGDVTDFAVTRICLRRYCWRGFDGVMCQRNAIKLQPHTTVLTRSSSLFCVLPAAGESIVQRHHLCDHDEGM